MIVTHHWTLMFGLKGYSNVVHSSWNLKLNDVGKAYDCGCGWRPKRKSAVEKLNFIGFRGRNFLESVNIDLEKLTEYAEVAREGRKDVPSGSS